jgi:prepilin-type N-terminal cleavage/methylation domain-containing protein/prepilin-type processing-associated H-X9-DG protein
MKPRPVRAFTLVEVLVVIALVALLAGMLVPALARARRSVHGSSCLGNLRQWGLATRLYATDHADHLPPDGAPNGISRDQAWYVELPLTLGERPYREQGAWRTNADPALPRNLWLCPANPRRSNGRMLFHYCLNRRVNGSGADSRAARLTDVPAPGETVWLFDNGGLAAVAAENNAHTNAHGAGAHFLFLDGHVTRHAAATYWDFRRQRGFTNPTAFRWQP